ncbi:MAG TPA: GxxExxY protein [Gemmataceae bacterium]|nr:GxxExxY protein [Gemmataceae bacterium]
MQLRGMKVVRQQELDVHYKGRIIKGLRIDVIVEDRVIVELKSVSKLPDTAAAQVLSYLKSTGLKRALLLNFGLSKLVDGIQRLSL